LVLFFGALFVFRFSFHHFRFAVVGGIMVTPIIIDNYCLVKQNWRRRDQTTNKTRTEQQNPYLYDGY
jgi:hypothetical protein